MLSCRFPERGLHPVLLDALKRGPAECQSDHGGLSVLYSCSKPTPKGNGNLRTGSQELCQHLEEKRLSGEMSCFRLACKNKHICFLAWQPPEVLEKQNGLKKVTHPVFSPSLSEPFCPSPEEAQELVWVLHGTAQQSLS
ncbi:unnamed protein product [Eretmochelys imbricata]